MSRFRRVIVIGLDGLEPAIVDSLLEAGELPSLARLRPHGPVPRLATTYPAQTPVAWSTFATGTNPGGHGIFDFLRRDPATYLPDLALSRYEQTSALLPPRAVNLRRGTPFWELLSAAGVPSVILRCPCTYPPDRVRGRMLAGLGVPDLRGGLGTPTFYTSAEGVRAGEGEQVVRVRMDESGVVRTRLIGPRDPRTRSDATVDLVVEPGASPDRMVLRSEGDPRALELERGRWSGWLKVRFRLGMLRAVQGAVRFLLVRAQPVFELYASPVNFDPEQPPFPISSPWDYAGELARAIGPYHTTGMVEDHAGLSNGRIGEEAFLAQCDDALREREAMLFHELDRFREGVLFCLFDTPDRVQHMFWRFREEGHPSNGGAAPGEMARVIEGHYRRCDGIVGRVLEHVDERTLLVVLSDHGFGSFRRGVHLNTWLHDHGFLALRRGVEPGEEAGDFLRAVDWSQTKAYALGLGGIYLNLKGREAGGIVEADEAGEVKRAIARGLTGLVDEARGEEAVRRVLDRDALYSGPYAAEAPDLTVCFNRGYRASWATGLGGVPAGHFEDNAKRWSGDHIVDPPQVPGVLLMNRPFRERGARMVDLAPTILAALGVPRGPAMEGESLLPQARAGAGPE